MYLPDKSLNGFQTLLSRYVKYDMGEQKSAGESLSLVPHSEAFALPITVERATPTPTQVHI